MLAVVYRESNESLTLTELTDSKATHTLTLPEDPTTEQYASWQSFITLPLNMGVIADVELTEKGTISNMINLKSFMVPGEADTVENRIKDPIFVETLANVAAGVLQEMISEPRVLH